MSSPSKILIATGGTGGHLFPAQSLAKDLLKNQERVLFAGAGLSTNRYFQKEQFAYEDVSSASPLRGNIFRAGAQIAGGILKSLRLLKTFKPDIVVGFGSYHSFPLLVAALICRVPIVLFEANAVPGKVNRLFSRWATMTAVHFAHASQKLSGKTLEVEMPLSIRKEKVEPDLESARAYFGLHQDRFTFLVFGGSQGALSVNKIFCQVAAQLSSSISGFQVIHLTGHKKDTEEVRRAYGLLNIPVCIKEFEENMALAWKAADIAICRSGASTLAELLACKVPAILIPYPHAADDHQRINAEIMEREVGGARMLLEADLTVERLYALIHEMKADENLALQKMQNSIAQYKVRGQKGELSQVVSEILAGMKR
ncbi:MAG: undecaprenyldiphospho-muramoylpentapeptide beta-N-acetylglucosaminyltransferase [Chlamydiales bacterium]|nr:undecaprenyldiphospho-muramoylpentapeptide beta-N-acetylglucosaminyltransferase [Chlamydiales bacterium]